MTTFSRLYFNDSIQHLRREKDSSYQPMNIPTKQDWISFLLLKNSTFLHIIFYYLLLS